jgi:hypothetical protein
MHHLVPFKLKVALIVALAFAVAAIGSRLGLGPMPVVTVVGVVEAVLIMLLLHSWSVLSRLQWLPLWPWMKIDLTGRWNGVVRTGWSREPNDPQMPDIPATLDVTQTWHEVAFCLETAKMRSRSVGMLPSFDPVTRHLRFRYFFDTEPTAAASPSNPPQRLGSAIAVVRLDDPDRMVITYTNERSPGGDVVLFRDCEAVPRPVDKS